jgi:hypothetical protein
MARTPARSCGVSFKFGFLYEVSMDGPPMLAERQIAGND